MQPVPRVASTGTSAARFRWSSITRSSRHGRPGTHTQRANASSRCWSPDSPATAGSRLQILKDDPMYTNTLYLGREWNVDHNQRVKVNNGELRYAVLGQGEPVLCIHGTSIADSLITPLKFYPPLLEEYQFISYYRAGYNGSTLDKSSLSIEEGAEHAKQLLDHLGIKRAHVLAFSFGGVIGFQFLLS